MQNNIIKFTTLTLTTILLSACASRPVTTNRQASIEIRDYKYASQKTDLNSVIDEKPIIKKDNFLIPLYNKSVHSWINYFAKRDKARFERYLKNGYKYKNLIENIFSSYDLPKDLFYVGLIESGYYLKARSSADAVGPWQFIKSTGKRYNLSVNRKVDERRSIVKSTHAAAKYFQDLYNIFGSWELALAAYNAGEYGVIRRIRGANTRDFHELSRMKKLPRETRNYIPKVLAAMEVAKNPRKYSINLPTLRATKFDNLKKVNLKGNYSVASLSRSYNVSIKTIKEINNDLKRNQTPFYPKDGYSLYLPRNSKDVRVSRIKKLNKRVVTKTAAVKARRTAKKSVNKRKSSTSTRKIASKTYRIRKGDNLHSIARKHHIKFSKLKRYNKIKNSKIFAGQKIKIPASRAKLHTVRKGEYLIKIAKTYGTTLSHLKKINRRSFKRLLPGQKIVISYN